MKQEEQEAPRGTEVGEQGSKDNLVVAGGAHRPAATRYLKRTEGRRDMRLSTEDMVRE